jgi:hypothetical protein
MGRSGYTDTAAAGAIIFPLQRSQSITFGFRIRRCRRVSTAHLAWPVHLRHDVQRSSTRYSTVTLPPSARTVHVSPASHTRARR